MSATILKLVESTSRDPAATLRRVADEIDAGEFGPVGCLAVVIMGDTVEVIGAGEEYTPPAIGMLLYAGFTRLSRALEEHGR